MPSWIRSLFDRGERDDESPEPADARRVEGLFEHHARTGQWPELAIRLDRLKRDGQPDAELAVWFRVRAVAALQMDRADQARTFLTEGLERHADEPRLIVALAALHADAGERDALLELDRRARHPEIPPGEAMAQVRRLALWHAHDDAVAALAPLLEAAYDTAEQLGGGGALVARGLPQGETLLRFGAALHAARGDDDAARVLLTEGGLRLPGVDVASLRDELTALRGGDAARLLDADLRAADDAERRGRPSACERLRVAVVASRDGRSASEAEDGLRAVNVTPLDPAWTEDVRRLALEDLAHRTGDAAGAHALRRELLRDLARAFAPDRGLRFLLVDAMERLAAEHRATFAGGAVGDVGDVGDVGELPTMDLPS